MRTGSPWRDLPAELGNWDTTYTRFKRWGESGVWQRVVKAIYDAPAPGTIVLLSRLDNVRVQAELLAVIPKTALHGAGGEKSALALRVPEGELVVN